VTWASSEVAARAPRIGEAIHQGLGQWGTWDCTRLVDGVIKQVDVVRRLLQDDVPVHGVLCFVEADWPLIGGAFTTGGVQVSWPKKLCQRLLAAGSLTADWVAEVHGKLARALPA
jgi:hypothetical protein